VKLQREVVFSRFDLGKPIFTFIFTLRRSLGVKKILLFVLAMVLSSAASAAMAGGPYPYYPEYPGPPPYYYYPPVRIPRDIRIQIAQLEKLKADMQYRTLSVYPNDMARAAWLADWMAFLNHAIEAWRLGYR
jgi:hypothetical protein